MLEKVNHINSLANSGKRQGNFVYQKSVSGVTDGGGSPGESKFRGAVE